MATGSCRDSRTGSGSKATSQRGRFRPSPRSSPGSRGGWVTKALTARTDCSPRWNSAAHVSGQSSIDALRRSNGAKGEGISPPTPSTFRLEIQLHPGDGVDRRRLEAERLRIVAVEEILDPREDLLVADVAPSQTRRVGNHRVKAMVADVTPDRARNRIDVVAIAEESVREADRRGVGRPKQAVASVLRQRGG